MEQSIREEPAGSSAPVLGVGPVLERFEGVRKIAVLRGGGLGDLLFALPAIEALAAAYPDADITLLGTGMHAALLEGRPGPVARVEVLPYANGVRPGPEDPAETAAFFERMRAERFDLAVQVHGGGRNSNPFLLNLGARHTVGTRTDDAVALERTIPYVYYQHEVLRALEVAGLAGAVPVTLEPGVTVTAEEAAAVAGLRQPGAPLVTIHPGATDPRRRWPTAAFAEVAGRLAEDGCQVLVVGDESDKALADEIVELAGGQSGTAAGTRVSSVAGRLTLGELAGVLRASDVMLANDSGPRHLGQAVGAATVGIYWIGNVINAGALGRTRHRIQLSWTTTCPVCGVDVTQVGWTAERCEHDDSFVAEVTPDAVYADALALLGGARTANG